MAYRPVAFTVTGGATGTVLEGPSVVLTDAQGSSQNTVRVGNVPGEFGISCSSEGLDADITVESAPTPSAGIQPPATGTGGLLK